MDTIGKIFHVKFLGFAHWFMSTSISLIKEHSISVDQARCDTSVVAKYIDTSTFRKSTKLIRPIFHLIWNSPRMIYLTVMIKLIICLGNSTLTTDIALVHWFIFFYKSRVEFCSTQVRNVFIKSCSSTFLEFSKFVEVNDGKWDFGIEV